MDCGADDTLCQVLALLFQENEFATGVLARWLGDTGILGAISGFLREHGDKLIGLAGFSFGFYRWWKYREIVLHKRLEEYLRENDQRLLAGQSYVLGALQRPSCSQKFRMPLFVSKNLQSVLRENNWDRTPVAANVLASADWQIAKAMGSISRQLQIADAAIASLRQQMATAQILRGAIASSKAVGNAGKAAANNVSALSAFRAALSIPGHSRSALAKELEAHQLRKLGHLKEAADCYIRYEELVAREPNERVRDIHIAQAKRYHAEVLQGSCSALDALGQRSFHACIPAYRLLRRALRARHKHGPYQAWDLLDQAEIHFLTATVADIRGGWPKVVADNLREAENSFRQILAEPHGFLARGRRSRAILRRQAKDGLRRVEAAQLGQFDRSWLPIPS